MPYFRFQFKIVKIYISVYKKVSDLVERPQPPSPDHLPELCPWTPLGTSIPRPLAPFLQILNTLLVLGLNLGAAKPLISSSPLSLLLHVISPLLQFSSLISLHPQLLTPNPSLLIYSYWVSGTIQAGPGKAWPLKDFYCSLCFNSYLLICFGDILNA